MLLLFLLLWSFGIILITIEPKNKTYRWGGLFSFFAGLGGLADVLEKTIKPSIMHLANEQLIIFTNLLIGFLYSLSHYLSPFTLLIFCVFYSELFNDRKIKSKIIIISVIPVILMYCFYPFYPVFKTSFTILSLWACPYILIANFFLIFAFLKTKQPGIKNQRLLVLVIFTPATLFSMFTNYIYPTFNITNVYVYNSTIIFLSFFLFLIFAIKYGVLGIKLRIEKQPLNNSFKSITLGTAILNHTIKNEITKIAVSMELIKSKPDLVLKTDDNIETIDESIGFLMELISRVQTHMEDIIIIEKPNYLVDVVESSLKLNNSTFAVKKPDQTN